MSIEADYKPNPELMSFIQLLAIDFPTFESPVDVEIPIEGNHSVVHVSAHGDVDPTAGGTGSWATDMSIIEKAFCRANPDYSENALDVLDDITHEFCEAYSFVSCIFTGIVFKMLLKNDKDESVVIEMYIKDPEVPEVSGDTVH